MAQALWFVDDHLLRVGSTEFHCEHPIGNVPESRLPVEKPRDLVEAYVELSQTLRPRFIVELGIYKGGSTALLAELNEPEKLVAIDLSTRPVPALTNYIEKYDRAGTVRPFYGVNQADRDEVTGILAAEFRGHPLDLVIDDASHLYDESVASFETLFPLVRPGGLYLIEDWRWQHQVAEGAKASAQATDLPERAQHAIVARMFEVAEGTAKDVVPLSRVALELVLTRASSDDIVADVAIGPYWVAVRRGPAQLDAGTFRMAETFDDHFRQLSPHQ